MMAGTKKIDFRAKPMRPQPPLNWISAWGIPYRERWAKGSKDCEAVITLAVMEWSLRGRCANVETASFVVDTGTNVTIAPDGFFQSSFRQSRGSKPSKWKRVRGITVGDPLFAPCYPAVLSIPNYGNTSAPFSFGMIEIAIVPKETWEHAHGVLGLDALRRVMTLSDGKSIFFWPPPGASSAL